MRFARTSPPTPWPSPIQLIPVLPHHAHLLRECASAPGPRLFDHRVRRNRSPQAGLGIDTWFLTGTDEHGQKIERSAKLAGCTPQDFADNDLPPNFARCGTASDSPTTTSSAPQSPATSAACRSSFPPSATAVSSTKAHTPASIASPMRRRSMYRREHPALTAGESQRP